MSQSEYERGYDVALTLVHGLLEDSRVDYTDCALLLLQVQMNGRTELPTEYSKGFHTCIGIVALLTEKMTRRELLAHVALIDTKRDEN